MNYGRGPSRLQLKRKPERVGKLFLRRLIPAALLAAAVLFALPYAWEAWSGLKTGIIRAASESAKSKAPTAPVDDRDAPARTPEEGARVVVVQGDGSEAADAPLMDESMDKKRLAGMIGRRPFHPDELYTFRIEDKQSHSLYVRTTLDPGLQSWAVKTVPQARSLSAALVAMDPRTGEVLAMASFRADGRPVNEALSGSFPAASLFKIVTAAAALEKKNINCDTTLSYDGRKHTLYKKDVQKDLKHGSHQVTLKEGFADSINTVFGKLGAFTLGKKELEDFARKFHFNQPIGFEMPVESSEFRSPLTEDRYRLAELASGFNRTTKVSPIHGAMLASAIVNRGRLMEPTVVREVFDLDNRIYYRHRPVSLDRVVSEKTVKELRTLMRATIKEGTGRKMFRDAFTHPVLSKLEIGGKSGTINNTDGNRVDWFVGYGRRLQGDESVALAVVVLHGATMGVRSQALVRDAIITYFRPRVRPKG